jgi:hypothetical protein
VAKHHGKLPSTPPARRLHAPVARGYWHSARVRGVPLSNRTSIYERGASVLCAANCRTAGTCSRVTPNSSRPAA